MSTKERLTIKGTIGFLRRLGPRVGPYRTPLVLAGVLMLCSVGIGLAFPLVVRELLDAAFLAEDPAVLNRIAIGLFLLFAVLAVINFSQSYLTASVSEKVVADLRRDIFGALVYQPPGFFANRRVGELSSRLASDSGLIQGVLRFGVPEIIRQVTFLIGALVLVTITNPRLTLVTLTAIPFAALVGWFFGRRVRRLCTNIQDRLADAVARAEQVFTQIRTVQSFTRESYENEAYVGAVNRARDEGLRRAMARASLTGAVTFAAFGAIVGVLWVGGRLVLDGALSPGTLVAFLLYAVTISAAITSLAGFWANLQEAAGAARRIFEILDHPVAIESPTAPRRLPTPVRGVVRYEGVTFRYEPHLPRVLDGIDLVLDEGVTVALVGISGSGKSTLASLIPRFFDVEEGSVTVDGIDVREMALDDLRTRIGIVPQEPMLFGGTVRENLLYGNLEASQAEIEEVSLAAHAADFIETFPDGYDQVVGERGVTLSAGQRQRIAIARVMLERPKLLILDEASSSLDSESEELIQDALERLMGGRTTLVIAHRLSTVIRSDRILVLDESRIVDEGSHRDLLERSEVYDRLYRRQTLEPALP
ncbi:MAG: ABC transporter transmembrane domain-containing protein [Gemmatimonadota bacterium]|nr:ABC transporter transmembrane domain-containing protein [Gemmatimonadota bacterium]